MSRSRTITNPDWLHNPHAGEMLVSEFMEPLKLDAVALAGAIEVPVDDLVAVIDGQCAVSGEIDLRLGRYLGMSEGFFLRLQTQYEIVEARRALNGQLDQIVPRPLSRAA